MDEFIMQLEMRCWKLTLLQVIKIVQHRVDLIISWKLGESCLRNILTMCKAQIKVLFEPQTEYKILTTCCNTLTAFKFDSIMTNFEPRRNPHQKNNKTLFSLLLCKFRLND